MVRRNPGKHRTASDPKDVGLQVPGEEIAFVASLPMTASAIQLHGDGGLRLSLDVSDDQKLAALRMAGLIHSSFDVIVRPRIGSVREDIEKFNKRGRRDAKDGKEPHGDLGLDGAGV